MSKFAELEDPKEMEVYWALIPRYRFRGNKSTNSLVLILTNNPENKRIKIATLSRRGCVSLSIEYIKRDDLKLIGFSDEYAGYSIEERWLTVQILAIE